MWVVTEGEDSDGGYGGQVSDKKQKAIKIPLFFTSCDFSAVTNEKHKTSAQCIAWKKVPD